MAAKKPNPTAALGIAQQYWNARTARLAKDKEAEQLKEVETTLKQQLIDTLHSLNISSVGDPQRNYALVQKLEPQADDWARIYAHIRETGDFDLMYRRINEKAVKERWEDGKNVPGVQKFPVEVLSVTKAKGA